jgi:NADPH2:quinone reductase
LKAGDRCLIHAAAGGVGLLLTQIAKRRGAYVIGTVGSEEKAELSRGAGADHVIIYTSEDFADETRRVTESRGVHVVYDSVGATTFLKGLDVLAPRGMMVLFGQSSGPVAPVNPQLLNQKGSLFLTRPVLGHYTATREELLWRSSELFEMIGRGELAVRIGAEHLLSEAATAHRELEGRLTTGKVILRVS